MEDCAHAYGNEAEVGKGIRESGVPREEIFVTTKLWSTFHTDVEGGLNASLQKLGLDYVDLFLVCFAYLPGCSESCDIDSIAMSGLLSSCLESKWQ